MQLFIDVAASPRQLAKKEKPHSYFLSVVTIIARNSDMAQRRDQPLLLRGAGKETKIRQSSSCMNA
jgi:hypothetical protein